MKIHESRLRIVLYIIIIVLSVLVFVPMTSSGTHLIMIVSEYPKITVTFWSSVDILLLIGIGLNLFSIKDNKFFQIISLIGFAITFLDLLSNLIVMLNFYYTKSFSMIILFTPNFYFALILVGVMISDRFLYFLSKKKRKVPTLDEKKELVNEIVPKSKFFLKKGLKAVTKKVGKVVGDIAEDMVEEKLTDITGNAILADIVGDITDAGVSKLTQAGLSKLTDKAISPSKSKGLLKKGLKGVTKKVGKIAGDMLGDTISDLTGNEDIGNMVGKFTKKGVSAMAKSTLDDTTKSAHLSRKDNISFESIKVDYKKRVLGIVKTKKQVKIDYIEKILKLNHIEIVGLIYELIGKGKLEGEFNSDDSVFTIQ